MELVRHTLLYLHLLGFAMLFGGWLTAYLSGRFKVNTAMLWGAVAQLVTGIALSAPLGREVQPDPAKLIVKAVLAIAIAVMVWVPHLKKRESSAKGHFLGLGAALLVEVGVAVFW